MHLFTAFICLMLALTYATPLNNQYLPPMHNAAVSSSYSKPFMALTNHASYSAPMMQHSGYSPQHTAAAHVSTGHSAGYSTPYSSTRFGHSAMSPHMYNSHSAQSSGVFSMPTGSHAGQAAATMLHNSYSAQYAVPMKQHSSFSAPFTMASHGSAAGHSTGSGGYSTLAAAPSHNSYSAPAAPLTQYLPPNQNGPSHAHSAAATSANARYSALAVSAPRPSHISHSVPTTSHSSYSAPVAHTGYSGPTTHGGQSAVQPSYASHSVPISKPSRAGYSAPLMAVHSFSAPKMAIHSFSAPMMSGHASYSAPRSSQQTAGGYSYQQTHNHGSHSSAGAVGAPANYGHSSQFRQSAPAAAASVRTANYAAPTSGYQYASPSVAASSSHTSYSAPGVSGSSFVGRSAPVAAAPHSAPANSYDTKYAANGGYLYR